MRERLWASVERATYSIVMWDEPWGQKRHAATADDNEKRTYRVQEVYVT
jgi:hypothetical protein